MRIILHPNSILRKKTADIDLARMDRKKLRKLAMDMIKTMYRAEGVGLAAPQVGESIRLCVIRKKTSNRYKEMRLNLEDDLILINPHIITRSPETDTIEEGCLSIPNVLVPITRPVWVKLRVFTIEGKQREFEARDFFARVVQHEIDHLDGILIIDK